MKEKIKLLLIHTLIEFGSIALSFLAYWLVLMAWLHGIISIHLENKENQHTVELVGIIGIGYIAGRAFNFFYKSYFSRWDKINLDNIK